MPTTKKRINITVDDELYDSIDKISKKDSKSLTFTTLRLIQKALELEEDIYFSKESDRRLSNKNEKRIPHSKAWKD